MSARDAFKEVMKDLRGLSPEELRAEVERHKHAPTQVSQQPAELPPLPKLGSLIPPEMQRDIHEMMQRYAYEAIAALRSSTQEEKKDDVLVKALRFYADPERYMGANQRLIAPDEYTPEGRAYMQDVTRDGGEIARAALLAKEDM